MRLKSPFACIIGAPRSGTTWLQAMLGAHPQICTAQELKVFDLFTAPWERSWLQLGKLQEIAGGGPRGLRSVWTDDEFYARLGEIVTDVYVRVMATKPGATVVLDKGPGYSRHVHHIRRLVPHVKFIHVVRDGRDVAVSLRAAANGWGRTWAPASIGAAGSLWRSTVTAARDAASEETGYLEIRYEEMQADGPAMLRRALGFVGLSATVAEAVSICEQCTMRRMQENGGPFDLPSAFYRQGLVGAWRREMSLKDRFQFDRTAGDLLRRLGYARDGWWMGR